MRWVDHVRERDVEVRPIAKTPNYLFIHSLTIYLSIHSLTHYLHIHSFIHSLYLFIHSFIYSLYLFIHSLIYSLYLFIHSLTIESIHDRYELIPRCNYLSIFPITVDKLDLMFPDVKEISYQISAKGNRKNNADKNFKNNTEIK